MTPSPMRSSITSPITSIESLRAALGLWRQGLARAWAPLLVYASIYAVGLAAPTSLPLGLLLVVVELLVWAVVSGALMRLALADRHPGDPAFRLGPAGLQWTGIETRLLGARLLLVLLLFLILVAAVFSMMLVGVVVAATTGQAPKPAAGFLTTPAGVAIALVALTFTLVTVWITTRLALSSPATVDLGAVQAFSTLALTRRPGAWRLLVWMPVLTAGVFALGYALRWVTQVGGLAPGAAAAARVAYAVLAALVQTPLAAGVSAHAYRRLKAAEAA